MNEEIQAIISQLDIHPRGKEELVKMIKDDIQQGFTDGFEAGQKVTTS